MTEGYEDVDSDPKICEMFALTTTSHSTTCPILIWTDKSEFRRYTFWLFVSNFTYVFRKFYREITKEPCNLPIAQDLCKIQSIEKKRKNKTFLIFTKKNFGKNEILVWGQLCQPNFSSAR